MLSLLSALIVVVFFKPGIRALNLEEYARHAALVVVVAAAVTFSKCNAF